MARWTRTSLPKRMKRWLAREARGNQGHVGPQQPRGDPAGNWRARLAERPSDWMAWSARSGRMGGLLWDHKMSQLRARGSSFQKKGGDGKRGLRCCHWKGSWRNDHCVFSSFLCFLTLHYSPFLFHGYAFLLSGGEEEGFLKGPLDKLQAFKKWWSYFSDFILCLRAGDTEITPGTWHTYGAGAKSHTTHVRARSRIQGPGASHPSPAHCIPLPKVAVSSGQPDVASAKVMLLSETASGLLTILASSGEGSWSLWLCEVSCSSVSNRITGAWKIRGHWWRTNCPSEDLCLFIVSLWLSQTPTPYSPAHRTHLVLHMLFIHRRILEALCSLKTYPVCVFLERVNTGFSKSCPHLSILLGG